MKKKSKKPDTAGIILIAIGVFLIFTSAALNTKSNAPENISNSIYIYDVLSTVAIILIPCGVALILKKMKK